MSKGLLVFICIMLVIACGIFIAKWREERQFGIALQAFYEYQLQDSERYREMYYDCMENHNSSIWSDYLR